MLTGHPAPLLGLTAAGEAGEHCGVGVGGTGEACRSRCGGTILGRCTERPPLTDEIYSGSVVCCTVTGWIKDREPGPARITAHEST